MGFDLNRVWQDPSPWAHPELFAAKSQVISYDKDPVYLKFIRNQAKTMVYFQVCLSKFRLMTWIFLLTSTLIQP